jgi:hypothetical protein
MMLHVVDMLLGLVIALQALYIRDLTKRMNSFEHVHMKNIVDMIRRTK